RFFYATRFFSRLLTILLMSSLSLGVQAQSPQRLIYTGQHEIIITPGTDFSLQLTGSKKDVANVEAKAVGNTVDIKDKLGYTFKNPVRIEITLGELSEFTLGRTARLLNDVSIRDGLSLVL